MVKFCPECAYPITDKNAQFCAKCGTVLPITTPITQSPIAQVTEIQQPTQPSSYISPESDKRASPSVTTSEPLIQDPRNYYKKDDEKNDDKERSPFEWIAIGVGGLVLLIIVSVVFFTLAHGISGSLSAGAKDTMYRANPEHTGVYYNSGIKPTNTELWRFVTGGGVTSSPAVWKGVVYVGSHDNNLYAIDEVTGKEKWRFTTYGKVFSSPAVSNGVVYIGSLDNNLYAIDAVTGKEKWRFDTGNTVPSSPAVSNGMIYIGGLDNTYAIDAVTGKEKWRFTTKGYVFFSPAVSNGVVYVGCNDTNTYAIDAVTGKEKWRLNTGFQGISSVAVWNGVVYVGSFDNNTYAIDAVTGKEKWRFDTGFPVISSPAVADGVVYVGSLINLYAIDAVTGKEKWRFDKGIFALSSPTVADGVIYIGGLENNLHAIDAVSGTEKWRFTTNGIVFSDPAVSDGVVYIGSDDGNIYAIGAGIPHTTVTLTPTIDPIVQIKNSAQNIPYDTLFRNNENYIGKTVYFRGKIIQMSPVYGDTYVFRVATRSSQYIGYIEDIVYVNYKGARFLEGDTIDLWAKVDGLKTYTAVLGNSISIPELTALHTELVSKESMSTSESSTVSQYPTVTPNTKSVSPTIYQIGQTATDGKLKVTVNNERFANKITFTSSTTVSGRSYSSSMDFQPSQGKQFLILDITVENIQSDTSETISPLVHYQVSDADGYQYPFSMYSAYLDKKFIGGELSPGQKMRGESAFEVPTYPNNLKFTFKYDLYGESAVFRV
jgi:outer membrane protein assembly factor BamB